MRIIGGSARGRTLAQIPKQRGLRPTTDRVREALFGILNATWNLHGLEILDLFAGSGALGCEALSRGASKAVFVDQNRAAIRTIEENLRRIGQPNQSVLCQRVIPALRAMRDQRFDIVLLDPPFDDQLVAPTLAALDTLPVLHSGATIVAEHTPNEPLPTPQSLQRLVHRKTRTYGSSCLSFWELPEDHQEAPTP